MGTQPDQSPLVVIVGETASGKSALALELAERYNGEIICADSRTIYKGMDIGTAKPSQEEQQRVPHHLLDVVEPGERFTVVDFKQLANQAIADISARGKLPIMVGGSGLYVDAVVFDYQFSPMVNPERRAEIEEMSEEKIKSLLKDQRIYFPENEKNKRYLVRALERGEQTPNNRNQLRANTLMLGLRRSKAELRARIEQRAQQMLHEGILDEVRQLGDRYGWESEAMTGNIYPIFRGVVEGKKRVGEAISEFVRSDLYLAKRQRTWFKRNPHIYWVEEPNQISELVAAFLAHRL